MSGLQLHTELLTKCPPKTVPAVVYTGKTDIFFLVCETKQELVSVYNWINYLTANVISPSKNGKICDKYDRN